MYLLLLLTIVAAQEGEIRSCGDMDTPTSCTTSFHVCAWCSNTCIHYDPCTTHHPPCIPFIPSTVTCQKYYYLSTEANFAIGFVSVTFGLICALVLDYYYGSSYHTTAFSGVFIGLFLAVVLIHYNPASNGNIAMVCMNTITVMTIISILCIIAGLVYKLAIYLRRGTQYVEIDDV